MALTRKHQHLKLGESLNVSPRPTCSGHAGCPVPATWSWGSRLFGFGTVRPAMLQDSAFSFYCIQLRLLLVWLQLFTEVKSGV